MRSRMVEGSSGLLGEYGADAVRSVAFPKVWEQSQVGADRAANADCQVGSAFCFLHCEIKALHHRKPPTTALMHVRAKQSMIERVFAC